MGSSLFWILILINFSLIFSYPEYIITAPKQARVGETYEFGINSFSIRGKFNFHYGISTSTGKVLVENNLNILIGIQRRLELEVPRTVPPGDYVFFAKSSGVITFNHTHPLTINRKIHSIFIQTDKFLYKPGQKVLFRVVCITPDLKPYDGPVDINIYDISQNKILKLENQKNDYGVITNELQLSNLTPLGQWKITAQTKFAKNEIFFQVAEYVLPKFQVEVLLDSFYVINVKNINLQEDLPITVVAKYTFGQPLKGKAKVTIQKSSFSPGQQFVKTLELKEGKADLKVTYKDLLKIISSTNPGSLSFRSFFVEAKVTETVTGVTLSGNNTFSTRNNPYKLQFLSNSPDNFKPGFNYFAYLELKSVDDSSLPLSELKNQDGRFKEIFIKATYTYENPVLSKVKENKKVIRPLPPPDKNEVKNFSFPLNENGFLLLSIPTDRFTSRINLEASIFNSEFKLTTSAFKSLSKFQSRDRSGIQVTLLGGQNLIKPNTQLKFRVKFSEPVKSFYVEVLSKGLIVSNQEVKSRKSKVLYTFETFVSKQLATILAPEARYVFSFATKSGELVADSIALNVLEYFSNEISISFNKNSTEPGDEGVVLDVKTSPNSLVGLLGVDQSVLLLSSGNDLTKDLVKEELDTYSNPNNDPFQPLVRRPFCFWCGWWPIWLGGSDTFSVIDNAGLFVFTDLYVQKTKIFPPFFRGPFLKGQVFADSGMPEVGANGGGEEEVRVRKDFPETFIWTEVISNSGGNYKLKLKVPDTITSWVTTGFSVSKQLGLGITDSVTKLTVVQPFFISLNLPFSIIRGEEFALQVTLFNYYGSDLKADVTLLLSKYFKVIDCVSKQPVEKEVKKSIKIANNDATSVYFWVVATSLGQIPIEVKALAGIAADAIQAKILVKPEGQPQGYSTSTFIQLKAGESFSKSYQVTLPPQGVYVPGSATVEVSAIGDVMGSTINNLDNLLQMPYGCGEQTILILAPDVYILTYLTVSRQLTDEIETKALAFINDGYQRELTFQRLDGSFSAFGNNDPAGSVWLSAFVIKCFHQAKDYIPVEDEKISSTLTWIINLQASNGSFYEAAGGRVIHTNMQGGSASGVSMTAYVLISLLENKANAFVNTIKLNQSIQKATKYLEDSFTQYKTDPYALSIISYALYRASSPKLNDVLTLLDTLAIVQGDLKYWKKEEQDEESNRWKSPYGRPKSYAVEISSYVLLVYSQQQDLSKSLPIAKWLLAQRNSNGGFSSTQDTVLGLEALASFASLVIPPSGGSGITVKAKNNFNQQTHTFQTITKQNSLILQKVQLPDETSSVQVSATGEGVALFQLSVNYNVFKEDTYPFLHLQLNSKSSGKDLTLTVTSYWSGKEDSGMVLIEINILTGYEYQEGEKALMSQIAYGYKRLEISKTKINIYFDQLTDRKLSFILKLKEVLPVTKVKPALVKLYRYYETTSGVTGFYSPSGSDSWENACPLCCPSTSKLIIQKK